jgi:hypothetical protein
MSDPDEISGSADQVDAHVFIGGFRAAADPRFIRRQGITRIVKLFADSPQDARHPGVAYYVLPAVDTPSYDIRPALVAAVPFIREGVARGENVLVHCHMGISRSATVVLLYLMLEHGVSLDAALRHLKKVRPVVNPNPGFMEHLRATDARLRELRARR